MVIFPLLLPPPEEELQPTPARTISTAALTGRPASDCPAGQLSVPAGAATVPYAYSFLLIADRARPCVRLSLV